MTQLYVVTHNALEDGSVGMTPAADSKFPPTQLYRGSGDEPAVYGSIGADSVVTADLAMWGNGNLETWSGGLPVGFFQNSGTITQETGANARGGSGSCARLVSPTGEQLGRTRSLRAGGWYYCDVWAKNVATSPGARLFVYNKRRGTWLQHGTRPLAWSTTYNYANIWAGTTYNPLPSGESPLGVAFQVESIAACAAHSADIQFTLQGLGGGVLYSYFDDFNVWPLWDLAYVHGHNLPPRMGMLVQSSADGVTWGGVSLSETTGIVRRQGIYAKATSYSRKRHVRVKFPGTPDEALYMGKLIVGQALALTDFPEMGITVTYDWPQIRNKNRMGAARVSALGPMAPRVLEMNFEHRGLAAYQQVRDELYLATRQGADALVFVGSAFDTDSDATTECVLYGRLEDPHAAQRRNATTWSSAIRIIEEPFPQVTS